MEIIFQVIDFAVNIDKHLPGIMQSHGTWAYLLLFLIIFCETGLVVTPFLPGDSFLFVIGALGTTGAVDLKMAVVLLIIAAVGGNTLNYFIGKMIGQRFLESSNSLFINRIIKKEYLLMAHVFYEKHGGKAISLSRFLPILRTFLPFVAGIGKMNLAKFTMFNSIGAIAWVSIFMMGGYFWGNIPVVQSNFSYVILGIILVSLLPAIVTGLNAWRKKRIAVMSEE